MPRPRSLLTGLAYGESPRWHDGRLWFCNWVAQQIVAVDPSGNSEVVTRVPFESFPFSIDWLPDGRLLMASMSERPLLRREPDGAWVAHADTRGLAKAGWNEIVVDRHGNAYVNGGGFDMRAGEPFAPGIIARVTPDGAARQVADDIHSAFDIGADGSLTHRRVWADLVDGAPDGICFDAGNAIWYADVPNKRCVRVREGGAVLQTIDVDRGCFACMLGGADKRTLFILAAEWHGFENMTDGSRTGEVLTAVVSAPGAGWP